MNEYFLPHLEEWEDFDRVATLLTKTFGWIKTREYEGLGTRVGEFTKDNLQIILVYDDMGCMDLKCRDDATHLPIIGKEILTALNLPLPREDSEELRRMIAELDGR